jgi:osmotically-inducible protein OsmY
VLPVAQHDEVGDETMEPLWSPVVATDGLLGVMGVEDEIELIAPGPTAHDVEHSIKKAMERNAKLDAESVAVESSNGTITLRGTVSSWADHDEAVAAAWAAPGVTRVDDDRRFPADGVAFADQLLGAAIL